ncbi:MAG TPA: hypothetical protein VJP40_02245 [bacterium]|nr:hypothetical protein [bacterium]
MKPLTLIVLSLFFVPWAQAHDMEAPWNIGYSDGSANGYRFWQDSANGPARFQYSPVRPEESSTGFYSGGEPVAGILNEKQAHELWHWVLRFDADPKIHTSSRDKGTGAFNLKEKGGSSREFIVQMGASLREWDAHLTKLRHQDDKKEKFSGRAENAKGGAVLVSESRGVLYIEGLSEWPPELQKKSVVATGTLRERESIPSSQVDASGAVSAGAKGKHWVLQMARWRLAP